MGYSPKVQPRATQELVAMEYNLALEFIGISAGLVLFFITLEMYFRG